ncbi:hypothetical protein EDD22DRAFT_854688 [Suillus occidentalis]|nr:hypothetical protein EDD22DRAFT_854688 [Suillus occidentalis]
MLRKPLLLQWEVKWQLVANDDINKDRLRASHLFLAASSHFNANRENRANEGWMMGSQEELYDEAAWKERPAGPSEEENIVAFIFVEDLASPKAGSVKLADQLIGEKSKLVTYEIWQLWHCLLWMHHAAHSLSPAEIGGVKAATTTRTIAEEKRIVCNFRKDLIIVDRTLVHRNLLNSQENTKWLCQIYLDDLSVAPTPADYHATSVGKNQRDTNLIHVVRTVKKGSVSVTGTALRHAVYD